MRAKDLIEAMAAWGLWSSPAGKAPEATLYAAICTHLCICASVPMLHLPSGSVRAVRPGRCDHSAPPGPAGHDSRVPISGKLPHRSHSEKG